MSTTYTVFCLLFLLPSNIVCQPRPAIYIDNGFDQTAMDHLMTKNEKAEIELEILNLLGLPRRPKRVESPLKMSASRYLLDVYQSLMKEENEENNRVRRDTGLTLEEHSQIEESDLIMSFEGLDRQENFARHKRGKALWFNVSDIPVAEDIIGAELRLFKKEVFPRRYPYAEYTIRLSQALKIGSGDIMEYMSSANITDEYSGWLKFNLTSCLANWVVFPSSNYGIYLSVHPSDKPGKEIKPDDIGLVTTKGQAETDPFMVAFMRAVNHVSSRSKRSTKSRIRKSNFVSIIRGAYKSAEPIDTWRTCRLHNLYISFKDLQWQDWIIAPDGYAAYYCGGECNFPIHGHLNATNHAIVQTLVHLMNPLRYPKPCCAPTKLKPISVLYFLDDHNVILKKYKNMMVKSCGCH